MLDGIAPVVISPVIDIEHLVITPDLRGVDALVITSQNAITALADQDLPPIRTYCVGDQTAEAAKAIGLKAISAQGNVRDLVDVIKNDRLHDKDRATGRLLHIRGEHIAGDLASALGMSDITLDSVIVYKQVPQKLNDAAIGLLSGADTVIIPIFSPRSGTLLVGQFTGKMTARRIAICLSPSIASQMDPTYFQDIRVSGETSGISLRDCVASCVKEQHRLRPGG